MTKKLTAKTKGVSHHLPHRTRLRVANPKRRVKEMAQVSERLKRVPGVTGVEMNDRTGSILVHHEENDNVLELLGTALKRPPENYSRQYWKLKKSRFQG